MKELTSDCEELEAANMANNTSMITKRVVNVQTQQPGINASGNTVVSKQQVDTKVLQIAKQKGNITISKVKKQRNMIGGSDAEHGTGTVTTQSQLTTISDDKNGTSKRIQIRKANTQRKVLINAAVNSFLLTSTLTFFC